MTSSLSNKEMLPFKLVKRPKDRVITNEAEVVVVEMIEAVAEVVVADEAEVVLTNRD